MRKALYGLRPSEDSRLLYDALDKSEGQKPLAACWIVFFAPVGLVNTSSSKAVVMQKAEINHLRPIVQSVTRTSNSKCSCSKNFDKTLLDMTSTGDAFEKKFLESKLPFSDVTCSSQPR